MSSPMRPAIARLVCVILVASLIAACSSGPESQATSGSDPTAAPAPTAASEAPASTGPATAPPSDPVTSPEPTAPPPAAVLPPKPAKVTFKHLGSQPLNGGTTRESYRVGWAAPDGAATTFSVYGVTECLRASKQYNDKPCVVKGMKIPKRALKLIAQVPGTERSVDIAWKVSEIGPGPYAAVLVRATNAAGDSIFTIAWSEAVCWRCTY